jgi:DNA-binding response OmpR family regulator
MGTIEGRTMTEETSDAATVLVVDDESSLADLYAHWLSDTYEVRTAYGGEDALEEIDDDVDILLLDRRMPDLSGDEVLERVRQRNFDVRIAMVTAVDPDFDIVDMECDDYVVKSVTKEDLEGTVEHLLRLAEYDQKRHELSSKQVRRNVLQVEKTEAELDESEDYQRLEDEIAALKDDLGDISDELDDGELEHRL